MRRLPGWISRSERESVTMPGRARLGSGREVDIQVTNLSKDGCRIESNETLLIGDLITLNAKPLHEVPAIIRWELCGTAGVRFVQGDWI